MKIWQQGSTAVISWNAASLFSKEQNAGDLSLHVCLYLYGFAMPLSLGIGIITLTKEGVVWCHVWWSSHSVLIIFKAGFLKLFMDKHISIHPQIFSKELLFYWMWKINQTLEHFMIRSSYQGILISPIGGNTQQIDTNRLITYRIDVMDDWKIHVTLSFCQAWV